MRFTKTLAFLFLALTLGSKSYASETNNKKQLNKENQSQSEALVLDQPEAITTDVHSEANPIDSSVDLNSESLAESLVEDDPLSEDFEFEDLICDQASKSKCERIKKEARFKIGQKISDKDLRNAKIRIQLLGLFKTVNLNLKKGSKKGKILVAVETTDRSPIYTITGIQAGIRNRFEEAGLGANTDFTVGHRDVFGSGKNLSLSARGMGGTNIGEVGSLLLRYSDPNLLGSRKWFYNLELFSSQNRKEYSSTDDYVGSLEIGRRYGNFSYWTFGYAKGYSQINRYQNEAGWYKEDSLILGYGYNTQDDLYFPTSGTRINLKIALELYSEASLNLSPFSFSSIDGNFDWRTTFKLDDKLFITWFFEGRGNQFEQDDFINNGLGFELGYQKIRNQTGSDITDLRYYIAPSITGASSDGFGSDQINTSLNMGVKFRSQEFGLVRLGAFWGHE